MRLELKGIIGVSVRKILAKQEKYKFDGKVSYQSL